MSGLFTLNGFSQFADKLHELPSVLRKEVGEETFEAARHWADLSRRAAPKDQGRLVGSISASRTGELSSKMTCDVNYGAYMEWGTKKYVRVPGELAGYAATFRGGGAGGSKAKEMIYAWMKRVGIPKEFQWVTFIRIIVNGVRPHPFFFPPKPIVEKEFVNNVKKIINTEH